MPKGFAEFRKKWLGKVRDGNGWDWFVQFTNRGDPMDRSMNPNPSHSDPMGIYAYPIRYALNHPGDIWYGSGAAFLRVLAFTRGNRVSLTDMSERVAEQYIFDLSRKFDDLNGIRHGYDDIKKMFKFKGSTAPGKVFFAAIQTDFMKTTTKKRGRTNVVDDHVCVSSVEQNRRLRGIGIDALEDNGRNLDQAVINDREPEQVVFLSPHSFKVLDVFRLSGDASDANHVRVSDDNPEMTRKLAARLAAAMEDKLDKQLTDGFWTSSWATKAGRTITITAEDADIRWKMDNLRMGQKKHKHYRLHNRFRMDAKIKTELGDFEVFAGKTEHLANAAQDFRNKWLDAKAQAQEENS